MKYAVLYAPKDLRIEEKPLPETAPDRVLIKIFACGVCGTDVHIYEGRIPKKFPYSPGHECCGVVQDVGGNIKHIKVGDRVAVDPNHNCGSCYYCRRGYPNLCEDLKTQKVKSNGGFAEYVLVPEKIVHKIPDTISFEEATLIETLSCSIHVVEEANIRFGDVVVIIGGGAMGLILLQLVRQKGAGLIVLSEPVEGKRNLALKLGADVVIEAVGTPQTIELAIRLARKSGRIIIFGFAPEREKASFIPFDVLSKELTIMGSWVNPYTFSRSLDILSAGKIDVKSLVSLNVPLDNIMDGFSAMQEKPKGFMKALVVFEKEK